MSNTENKKAEKDTASVDTASIDSDNKSPTAKIDYLHPEGSPTRKPDSKEEKVNEKQAKESTEIANKLKP